MIIPINKNAIYNYSLVSDTDENKTIFHLGYLNSTQKAALSIQAKKATKDNDEPSLWWFTILRFALKGWSNFKLPDGTEYLFKTDKLTLSGFGEFTVMSDDCFAAFTLDQVAELASKLYEINYVQADEKKESPSPSTNI
jgi:hypothetical protein